MMLLEVEGFDMSKLFRTAATERQAVTPASVPENVSLATVAPAWWEASKKHAELSRRKDELQDEARYLGEQISTRS
jgi:hypothetical protein